MEEVAQRTSFVLHLDTLAVLDELTDEQAGQFIKAIYLHRKGVEFSVDPLMKALLVPFIAQMKRDDEKYTKKVNANRNNGLKGGRPKANGTQENPLGFSETQHKPNESQKTREGEGEGENKRVIDILSAQADQCPHKEILKIWGQVMPELIQPRSWDGARAKDLAARWKSKDIKADSLDYWKGLFEYIRESDFLMGRTSGSGREPMRLSLDWVVKAANYNKIIEGKYHA